MTDPRITESLSPEVQEHAEELRKLVVSLAADYGDFAVELDGTINDDGREYVITVQPKGLAELTDLSTTATTAPSI